MRVACFWVVEKHARNRTLRRRRFINPEKLTQIMLDKTSFATITKEMQRNEQRREEQISLSKEMTKKSKQAIYLVHRGKASKAEQLLDQVAKQRKKVEAGWGSQGLQEYAEAVLFLHFVKTGKVLPYKDLKVGAENYLGGLADFTGEIERRAVLLGAKHLVPDVQLIRDTIDGIMGSFMKIDLRNGELRRKYDAIKWNLKRVENVLYDLRIHT